ncbi:MAG: M23 family metallopeptidase [Nitrosomonadaceae bacterium]|nr:M23 family metallopeptidase [Nitrosomonadaceae bacterium]MDW7647526.1 M23 family metallopeptidase [Nitrosomonadaceae bacterium]MDW7667125.1 M23 family metallopeptidase [Nitrosomonadaceae bacterium]
MPTKRYLRWSIALASLPLFGMVAAFGIAPDTSLKDVSVQQVILNLDLPETSSSAIADTTFWRQERIQRGDTVAALLSRFEVNNLDAANFLHEARKIKAMHQLVPGRIVHAQTTARGELRMLRYFPGGSEQFLMEKTDGAFKLIEKPIELEKHVQMKSGVIDSSLFAATDSAGVPDNVTTQIVDIFSSEIDFHRDLRKGDRFTVVYESLHNDGELARAGRILAVEFVNQGTSYKAVYFQADDGNSGYYAPDGKNLRKEFLRSPLEFSRVSSGFSSARFHPVLQTWRAHKGVDYAAPTGTIVKATANGTVAFAGWQSGYGNIVILQHQGQYTTAYGHLSAFSKGLRKGQRVSQSDVIGYVGATGMATGPHLHYEFRVSGVQRDPLRVAMPVAIPILAQNMTIFHENTRPLTARLDMLRNTNLGSLD